MSDEQERRLERQARAGDAEAAKRLQGMRCRRGEHDLSAQVVWGYREGGGGVWEFRDCRACRKRIPQRPRPSAISAMAEVFRHPGPLIECDPGGLPLNFIPKGTAVVWGPDGVRPAGPSEVPMGYAVPEYPGEVL